MVTAGKARRAVLGPLLIITFLVSVAWIIFGSPGRLLTFVLVLAAAGSVGGLALLFVPGPLKQGQKNALGAGLAVATFLVAYLAIPGIRLEPRPAPSPTPTEIPSVSTPSSPSPTPSSTEVLFDDFNGEAIDRNKWARNPVYDSDPKQLPKQIYIEGGKLHLEVSPENSPTVANAELKAKFPSDWTITKISVKMTLERQRGRSDGAAHLSISSFDDRETRAWMGPGGENQNIPMLGYESCPQFDTKCTIINQREILIGQEYQIDAVANQKDSKSKRHLDFQVSGEDWGAYAKADAGEIRSFRFYLFSDPKRDFHVTVDEIRITYI